MSGLPEFNEFRSSQLVLPREAAGREAVNVTAVVAVATLFPDAAVSPVADTVAVLVTGVAEGICRLTRTTRVKTWLAAGARLVREHETGSVEPAAWGAQLQPAGAERDTSRVFAGMASVSETLAAVLPATELATVIVYVVLLPATTVSGLSELVTLTSAWVRSPG